MTDGLAAIQIENENLEDVGVFGVHKHVLPTAVGCAPRPT